jgi:hypothetical protein
VSVLNDAYEHEALSVLRSSYAPLIAVYALVSSYQDLEDSILTAARAST